MVELEGRLMKRLFLILFCLISPSMVLADDLHVDGIEYESIQAAIDDANNGDIVIVEPNTYYETIDFLGK